MPCPTCDHTLGTIADNWHTCPRCGTTVQTCAGQQIAVYVPKLVERCREFEAAYLGYDKPIPVLKDWHSLGIAEAINKPEDRPK